MSKRFLDSIAVLTAGIIICGLPALLAADETQPASADKTAWGSVTGRVVFEGDIDDPLLDRFRGEIPVYEGARSLRAAAGLEPDVPGSIRQVGVEINRTLIIDESTRGVKNAFVFLYKAPDSIHPRYAEKELEDVAIVSRHTRFVPRACIVQLGQTVDFKNLSPNYSTNIHTYTIRNPGFNSFFEPFKHREWKPRRAERIPIKIQSDMRPMAKAWVLIMDHPYAVITAKEGTFTIPDLPVGKHRLRVWHETIGHVDKFVNVTVEAGKTTKMPNCKLTLKMLRKKQQR